MISSDAQAREALSRRDDLLRTKVGIRVPRDRSVPRPELLALLDEGLGGRLVLVSAPAGFGKTTLVAQWLAARKLNAGWLTVDRADNDPARFTRYLLAAARPIAGDSVYEGLEALSALPRPDVGAAQVALANVLAEIRAPVVLVLDDYHLITAPAAHALVANLLECQPPGVTLVIVTRVDPPLRLARLRARGELGEIRAESLRFSVDEGAAFLNGTLGLQVVPEDVELLVGRTEGWAAGLQLAGLSLRGQPDPRRFVQTFSGSNRFVLDYLAEDVLEREPTDVQGFLLRTSVLERLCGPLCDAVTGGTGGEEMLRRMERANLFLVPLDEEHTWFRYHQLFASLLRARLGQLLPNEEPALLERASAWWDERGSADQAIRYALASGNVDGAAALVEKWWVPTHHDGFFATVLAWLNTLPSSAVRSHPVLSAAYAWMLVLEGRSEGVEERLRDAEQALAQPDPPGTDEARETVPSQIATIRSRLARRAGQLEQAVAFAEEALAVIPPGLAPATEAVIRGSALLQLGRARREQGRLEAAFRALEEAGIRYRSVGDTLGAAHSACGLAEIETGRGHPARAVDVCREALTWACEVGTSAVPATGLLHATLAEALLAAGHGEEAAAEAREGRDLARRGGAEGVEQRAQGILDRLRPVAGVSGACPRATVDLAEPLTTREQEVLGLVAAGRSNQQIAEDLVLAVGTVKTHVHAIFGKLGAQHRAEAVARARTLGLVE